MLVSGNLLICGDVPMLMKTIFLSLVSIMLCVTLRAQFTYRSYSPSQVPVAAQLNMRNLPAGFAPSILREAPKPMGRRGGQPSVNAIDTTAFKPGSTTDKPVLIRTFAAQGYQFSAPNDNHLSVGANGKMISVVNTNITGYDTIGTVLFSQSLSNFADTLGALGYTFDPRVIYDPIADKYIVTFLNGFLDSTSQIILGFSQTADPEGEWNYYVLNGNPLNNQTWSDYPAIGISQEEVFITFNTFTNGSTNNSGYTESTIWQINKQNGYAGQPLNSQYYYDLKWNGDTIFNTTPVTGGVLPYGPNMYFLHTNPFSTGTDTLYILEITNTIASGNAQMQMDFVRLGTQYYEPTEAKQRNNHTLITNDARVQSAILEYDILHVAFNSYDPNTTLSSVYYGRVSSFSGTQSAAGFMLADTLEYAYPCLAYAGDQTGSAKVMMGFLHSSATTNAGHSAVYIDDNMQVSEIVRVKTGNNILNVLSGTSERWGDYTGMSIQPGEPGSVWYGGSYSSGNARNMSWLSKMRYGQLNVSNTTEASQQSNTLLYPNPGNERIQVRMQLPAGELRTFTVSDIQGKWHKVILRDWMRSGSQEFSFSTEPLAPGYYILHISNATGQVLEQHPFTIIR
jgi:hypothetical protein